eukprot:TRINITY_DN6770_c0_g1_i1.p1 TRINITY_DN6770_c0_g1~~TRINITY_DN6770_c0_g1_i1.p1  ORF type:complete len:247 (-),score=26.11 TRINITY_DN6770_c0_g1_i1:136-876(-)
MSGRTFSSLVNPQEPIDRASARVHRISNAMVRSAPTFDLVYRQMLRWLEGILGPEPGRAEKIALLVAHNGGAFDERILRQHVSVREGFCAPLPSWLYFGDSLRFFRKALPRRWYSGRLGLDALRQLLSLPHSPDRHRALTDARLLWRCMRGIAELLSGSEDAVALAVAFFLAPRRFGRASFAYFTHAEARVRLFLPPSAQAWFTFKPSAHRPPIPRRHAAPSEQRSRSHRRGPSHQTAHPSPPLTL